MGMAEMRKDLGEEAAIHARALTALNAAQVPYVVGGAFALRFYTKIYRDTKDLDVFLMKKDVKRALEVCAQAGFLTELTDPLWLAKAFEGEYFVDLIFSSGNGIAAVDQDWIEHAAAAEIQGVPSLAAPPEEMIWSKAFVQERHRYDGADVAHLIHACGRTMDWRRLYRRMEPHWEVLFAHLLLFHFSYPAERDVVPQWLMRRLAARAARDGRADASGGKVCRGTLLSRLSYLTDVEEWGYQDARAAVEAAVLNGTFD